MEIAEERRRVLKRKRAEESKEKVEVKKAKK